MPVYAYKCEDCGSKHEYFHKNISEIEDVSCPNCNSTNNKRVMSSLSFGGFSANYDNCCDSQMENSCPIGGCCCGN